MNPHWRESKKHTHPVNSLPSRRNLRLPNYDYRQHDAYFVTICTHRQTSLFGRVADDAVLLNPWGMIVEDEWRRTQTVRANVTVDIFVVMPNHLHGILLIATDEDEPSNSADSQAPGSGNASGSLGQIIGHFKSIVTKRIRGSVQSNKLQVWQRNYYERIIRSERELQHTREYILANPARWANDELFVAETRY